MALSPEEMNKRRQKREAQLKRQKAQRRKLIAGLCAAVVILCLCGFGIYKLAQNAPAPAALRAEETVPETTAAPTQPPKTTRDPITTIHIRAAGDLNITTSVVDSGLSAAGYDYTRAFQDVASTLAAGDLTVLNLEGNICGEPYGSTTTSAPPQLIEALRNAGVDLVQMANSCSINNGLIGLNNTLNALRAAGIEPVGAYSSPTEYRRSKGYTLCDIQGVRVAFVAFTKGVGGMGMPAGNEDCVNLLYEDYDETYRKINSTRITQILSSVAEEKPDLIVALLHWGSENNDTISSTQESILNLLKKNGVNLVIGSHPHRVQKIDFDPAAGTLVAYSLGDFYGDAKHGGTNYSIILDIEITKDADLGITRVTGYSVTPIYTLTEAQSSDAFRRVVRIQQAMEAYDGNYVDKVTKAAYEDMKYSMERIQARITDADNKKEDKK